MVQTCGLHLLPGAASAGHCGGWHDHPPGQEGSHADSFSHLSVPRGLVLHWESGEGSTGSCRLPYGQCPHEDGRFLHLSYVSLTVHPINPDISGVPKPRSGIQRGHLGYLSPYGSRDGRVSGEEGGIHEGVGPGKVCSVVLGTVSVFFLSGWFLHAVKALFSLQTRKQYHCKHGQFIVEN